MKPKKWRTALILSIFLGLFGIDRFYLGYSLKGILKLFTAGGFYIWWIIDIIQIARNSLRDANGMKLER
ncbi:TM2 domain-containing protein [Archaeoglobales archaeon]|nr:MAG: TM2 domain-containing protein [Archaeoglobales archaeon]